MTPGVARLILFLVILGLVAAFVFDGKLTGKEAVASAIGPIVGFLIATAASKQGASAAGKNPEA